MDLIGVNVSMIPTCQSAIEEYVRGTNEIINKLRVDAGLVKYPEGVQGVEQKAALEKYVTDAIDKINGIVENLNKFNESLNQVVLNYNAQEQQTASSIKSVKDTEVTTKTGVVGFGE